MHSHLAQTVFPTLIGVFELPSLATGSLTLSTFSHRIPESGGLCAQCCVLYPASQITITELEKRENEFCSVTMYAYVRLVAMCLLWLRSSTPEPERLIPSSLLQCPYAAGCCDFTSSHHRTSHARGLGLTELLRWTWAFGSWPCFYARWGVNPVRTTGWLCMFVIAHVRLQGIREVCPRPSR